MKWMCRQPTCSGSFDCVERAPWHEFRAWGTAAHLCSGGTLAPRNNASPAHARRQRHPAGTPGAADSRPRRQSPSPPLPDISVAPHSATDSYSHRIPRRVLMPRYASRPFLRNDAQERPTGEMDAEHHHRTERRNPAAATEGDPQADPCPQEDVHPVPPRHCGDETPDKRCEWSMRISPLPRSV
jgi:hypothetical protein